MDFLVTHPIKPLGIATLPRTRVLSQTVLEVQSQNGFSTLGLAGSVGSRDRGL